MLYSIIEAEDGISRDRSTLPPELFSSDSQGSSGLASNVEDTSVCVVTDAVLSLPGRSRQCPSNDDILSVVRSYQG